MSQYEVFLLIKQSNDYQISCGNQLLIPQNVYEAKNLMCIVFYIDVFVFSKIFYV